MIKTKRFKPDIIIIGAGISGCTVANIMAENNKNVLILDKRDRIGGNCADSLMDNYYVHDYGPHIFHTSNDDVWAFVNEFTSFNNFVNSPLVKAEGNDKELFNLPFNMNLFSKFFGEYNPSKIKRIIEEDIEGSCKKYNIDKENPKNLEEQAISLVGKKIYNAFIKSYTEKQWGKSCKELDASIIKRLPLRFTFNNNYFNDYYQGIPENGYSEMLNKMIDDKKIQVRLNIDFNYCKEAILKYVKLKNIPLVYTGPIDELFDYKFGKLEWRTVKFEHELVHVPNYQGNAVINYATKDDTHTRIIEHKHFTCIFDQDIYQSNRTLISKEYSIEWKPGMEPYYPINNESNFEILQKYQEEANKNENLYLLGRLAEYRYKDMAPSIDDAIKLSWEIINYFS
ncbi:MAG: UDP-galactopyranose mutase [Erysipelotrichales bacterium]|nr:UDP-galactopyranose mutase [Erysipelotrichales bacterium]